MPIEAVDERSNQPLGSSFAWIRSSTAGMTFIFYGTAHQERDQELQRITFFFSKRKNKRKK